MKMRPSGTKANAVGTSRFDVTDSMRKPFGRVTLAGAADKGCNVADATVIVIPSAAKNLFMCIFGKDWIPAFVGMTMCALGNSLSNFD